MKRILYSGLSRVFLTILLLFSSISFGVYGFLTLRAPLLYGSAETVQKTATYSKLFSKYVERTAVYTRYLEDGYSLKMTEFSPELELLLAGEPTDEDLETALLNVYRPSETAFYYYHTKLNGQPSNYQYFVVNTDTKATYYSADFENYAVKKSGSIEEFLTTGILSESIYLIMNTENNRTMTNGGNSEVLNRSNLLWSMDFLCRPLSEMAEDKQYEYNYIYDNSDSSFTSITKTEETPNRDLLDSVTGMDSTQNPVMGIIDDSKYTASTGSSRNNYLLYAFVADSITVDEFSRIASDFNSAVADYHDGIQYTIIFFLTTLFLFVAVHFVSGHRANREGITMRVQDRIPSEFVLTACGLLIFVPVAFLIEVRDSQHATVTNLYTNYRKYIEWLPILVAVFSLYILLFGFFYFSIIRRLKANTLIKSSLLGRYIFSPIQWLITKISGHFKEIVQELPTLWTTILLLILSGIWLVVSIALICDNSDARVAGFIMLIMEALFWGLLCLHNALDHRRILRETRAMSTGNLSTRISLENMLRSNRKLSEDINHICDGLHNAVEEQTKSERMKTELITNVSHDIKTPLTSIINYIELLKNELPEEGTTAEYAEILSQKSWRLKALIDDLVEASKVSSGTIKLQPICFNASELVRQAVGDFEERLEEKNLTVVMSLPEEPVNVLADGEATHRIIENMLSNICKYALSGTRVFVTLDLPSDTGLALLTLKNTSAATLNKTPEELLTRFSRGNDARTGEGSGLGLSIAESLATLQGGKFYIEIDDDIFKAKLTIPLADRLIG